MTNLRTLEVNGTTYAVTDAMKPFLLDEEMASTYNTDSQYGDAALQAVLDGKQILVKIPNVSGDNYVANFSPVYFYQVPNQNSDYLYLFYLKDEKQTIDLSPVGLGQIQLPIYGELQMKLSKEYTECPLK